MKPFLQKTILLVLFLILIADLFSQEEMPATNTDTLKKKKEWTKPWTVSPYSLRAGAFVAMSNTSIGAGSDRVPYSIIDLENDLGMERNTYSVMFSFTARFRKHNRIDFSYFNINRSITATLQKEIHFGEHVYPVDAAAKAYLNTNVFRLSYGYSFITNKYWDVGALAGFHVLRYNVGMDFTGNAHEFSYDDNVKFTAPLPDIGLWGTYAFHDHWAITAEASYFSVKINDIKGRILNANLAAQYKINDHWEVDLGYNYYDIDVELIRENLNGNFDWSYSGPYANIVFKFDRFLPKSK